MVQKRLGYHFSAIMEIFQQLLPIIHRDFVILWRKTELSKTQA